MHEFSLAQGVLEIALAEASEHKLKHVSEVRVDLGSAAGVNSEALEFAWEYMRSTDARTESAELELHRITASGNCPNCGYAGIHEGMMLICPECGTGGFRLERGSEFVVTGISGV